MKDVIVKRADLLDKLKANREQHRAVFLDAQEGYKKAAIQELEHMLEEAKAGKRVRRALTLIEPMDQTKEYDRAISMLEWSDVETITLTQREFTNYVLDEWDWMDQFAQCNLRYSNSASTTSYFAGKTSIPEPAD